MINPWLEEEESGDEKSEDMDVVRNEPPEIIGKSAVLFSSFSEEFITEGLGYFILADQFLLDFTNLT
jgi:hypothetical protein